MIHVKDTLKAFDNFESKQQKCMKYFLKCESVIFWKFIQYTIYWDKTQMHSFFLSWAPTHHSFNFNS